ncbi:MAG: acyl-CoA thioesterase [Mycobacterium sp.]|nr:acyl-CoA thioesterase [Mycobacterium sp.]
MGHADTPESDDVRRATSATSDLRSHLGLRATDDPFRWELDWSPRVLTGAGALHGGAGLALTVEAAAAAIGRPVVTAAAQYLSFVAPPSRLQIQVRVDVAGHRLTQARTTVSANDEPVLTTLMTLGQRTFPVTKTWSRPPRVAPPEGCKALPALLSSPGTLSDVCEFRLAAGRPADELDGVAGPGSFATWCRLPGGVRQMAAGDVALFADFPLHPLSDAIGRPCTGTSLDNSIRIIDLVETEWVLCESWVDAVANGFGQVSTRLWAQQGNLLAVASQTLALRELPPVDPATGMYQPSRRRIVRR